MATINQILNEDKRHDKLTCLKITGRRLYIRDSRYSLHLGYPSLKFDKNARLKQLWRPIGIICLGCGYARAFYNVNGKRQNINDFISKSNEIVDNKGTYDLNRQQRRRYDRLEKKRNKKWSKLKINEPVMLKFEH